MAFSLCVRLLGDCSTIHSQSALFSFFFKVEIRSRMLNPLFRPGSVHSGSASWDNCGQDELCVSLFPDRFPHYACTVAQSAHFDFVESRVWACLSVTCHLHFWQEWPGSFTCHCSKTGLEWTPNKSQHTNLTPEKKILPPLLLGFDLVTFRSQVWSSTNKLSWLPAASITSDLSISGSASSYVYPPPC